LAYLEEDDTPTLFGHQLDSESIAEHNTSYLSLPSLVVMIQEGLSVISATFTRAQMKSTHSILSAEFPPAKLYQNPSQTERQV
jgi:hypothetical protein